MIPSALGIVKAGPKCPSPLAPQQTHSQQWGRAVVVTLPLAALVSVVRSESRNPNAHSRSLPYPAPTTEGERALGDLEELSAGLQLLPSLCLRHGRNDSPGVEDFEVTF